MANFNLKFFLDNPTWEGFENCRRVDLETLADHFDISVPRGFVKAEVKALVLAALMEKQVLVLPRPTVGEVVDALGTPTRPDDEVEYKSPDTLPRFDPLSPVPTAVHLQMEAEERAQIRKDELHLKLEMRRLELEAEKDLKIRQMDFEMRKLELEVEMARLAAVPAVSNSVFSTPGSASTFDISRHIALVPQFRESEVDSYFCAFERIAVALNWPRDVWPLLLQCKLSGKAQEVLGTLSLADSLNYDIVKATVLRGYELVPEAYRQKFRKHSKSSIKTFVEFAREKESLFDKWCSASKINDFEGLRELMLLEEFKNSLPERLVVYINEQKVLKLSDAAVLADEFVLTHKTVFPTHRSETRPVVSSSVYYSPRYSGSTRLNQKEERACFYCHKVGHVISECMSLKHKSPASTPKLHKSVGLIKVTNKSSVKESPEVVLSRPDQSYDPFIFKGFVSLTGDSGDQKPVLILRDTGAAQSVILSSVLPWSEESYCGSSVLLRGIEMGCVPVPLHTVHLTSDLVSGYFRIGVQSELPVHGVDLIMGNDLAGGKVVPVLEVLDKPDAQLSADVLGTTFPDAFPACAITRAQSRRLGTMVDLADSVLAPMLNGEDIQCSTPVFPVSSDHDDGNKDKTMASSVDCLRLPVTREELIAAQIEDVGLAKCFSSMLPLSDKNRKGVTYFFEKGLLMRKWTPRADLENDWSSVSQIVVPAPFQTKVLSLAHDIPWSGHLGVTKTYDRLLRHFFWPGMKRDVARYCRTCSTCQVVGKPNQVISPAPLCPIPVMGEPFEKVIIDCVGPLPRTKSGNQFLLTIMCTATRYPEAIPMRKITSKAIVKALIKYFSTFGFPKIVQTDQGTNFTSKLFGSVLKSLSVSHQMSSAYHPESQGALERWHQTLKAMLRKYCMDTGKDWDEGVPYVLFAIRETVQESLGFSPAELIFGHTVRGPLKVLKEQLMADDSVGSSTNVLDYVSQVRERLHDACAVARENLSSTQKKMKRHFDVKSVFRSFQPGDQVLVLLPVPGSCLSSSFSGPYVVDRKLSDTDYVIKTPDRRRPFRVCHINMIKAYLVRGGTESPITSEKPVVSSVASVSLVTHPGVSLNDEDGLVMRNTPEQCARLCNSEMVASLPTHLLHLNDQQRSDIELLITDFPSLFQDVPSRTNVLKHDINVGDAAPIKQHPYRVNSIKRGVMKKEVTYLLENEMAIPSGSPWSSPCLLIPKPDGTQRFCTDYRKVNNVTIPDSFPLPRMDDCIDTIGSAAYVTKLDLLKGYWQVPLTLRASEVSAFVTPDSFCQYTVMAFGMRNAPATFQRLVNIVLADVPDCTAYLDDLVVHSTTWLDHLSTLRAVFARLANASLTLNLAKCEFGKATVTYLGKEVGRGQVRTVAAKVDAITRFPAPATRRELRRFLGMTGYYRTFCRNFSTVVAPLTRLLSPSVSFEWTAECQSAFDSVKALLCTSPVLSAPDFQKPFKLEVDASSVGAGAVLLQEHDGLDHPVCYFSRKFNSCQSRYSTIEQETLALLFALQFFEVYVGSSVLPVVVYTDHNPLTFLSRMYNHNQRLMRWALVIQGYNLQIQHIKGSENIVADALSRA